MICISCGNKHNEKFCPNCGEKSDIPKITFGSTVVSTMATVTNMDKGFLYNLKNLTLRPKATIEEYLKGKRKQIFNPISFLIIAVTIYLLVVSLLKTKNIISDEQVDSVNKKFPYNISYKIGKTGGKIIYSYFKFFWVFTVIPLSLITKLFFRKYNFAEHLTINSFILGQTTLVVGTITFIIFRSPLLFNPFIYAVLMWYIYTVFGDKQEKIESLIKVFATMFFFFLILFSIIITLGLLNLN